MGGGWRNRPLEQEKTGDKITIIKAVMDLGSEQRLWHRKWGSKNFFN